MYPTYTIVRVVLGGKRKHERRVVFLFWGASFIYQFTDEDEHLPRQARGNDKVKTSRHKE